MNLSIIIVSWQVKDYLKNCLFSIYQESPKAEFEVIVIDNHSSDGTQEMVKKDFLQVRLIENEKNLGFAKAVNQGLKLAQGRYLLLLNPDIVVLNQALKKLLAFMEERPEAAIVGCRLLNLDGSLQPSVRRFPKLFDQIMMMLKLHHLIKLSRYLATDFDYSQTQEAEQVMGATFILRREVLEKVGLFDEKFYLWFDEVDYCQRAKRAGFEVYYTPVAELAHAGGQSFSKASALKNQWYFSLSRLRYFKKYHHLTAYIIILLLTPFSLFFTLINNFLRIENAH